MNIDTMELEDVKTELESAGVKLHHKTGEAKYRQTLKEVQAGTYEAPAPKKVVTKAVEETKPAVTPKIELTVEQEAMKLIRIIVSPNDPSMSTYPGMIFTVCSDLINNGRAVKKYVPFNNEEGWHVPHIIYEQIINAEKQKFKSVKMPNGDKQLKPYQAKMYNVQVLDPLTQEELNQLAASQKARGDA